MEAIKKRMDEKRSEKNLKSGQRNQMERHQDDDEMNEDHEMNQDHQMNEDHEMKGDQEDHELKGDQEEEGHEMERHQ